VMAAKRGSQIERHTVAVARVREDAPPVKSQRHSVWKHRHVLKPFHLVAPEAVLAVVAIRIHRRSRAIDSTLSCVIVVIARIRGDGHAAMQKVRLTTHPAIPPD